MCNLFAIYQELTMQIMQLIVIKYFNRLTALPSLGPNQYGIFGAHADTDFRE